MTDLLEPPAPGSVGPFPLPPESGEVAVHPTYLTEAPYRFPKERYTSADFAALERERLWPKVWQIACTLDQVAEPGDALDVQLGALAAVIVRDHDGTLRGFQNVCRHRGNTLCTGSQRGLTELRCPYHRWSWDLTGTLREVPSRRGFGNLDTSTLGLVPVQVDNWGPLVFVNFDLDAAPLSEWLEGVPADAAWADLDEFRCVVATRTDVPCNWKVVAEGFSETYHVQGIHQEMLGSIDDIHAPQQVWGRHSASYQDYGVPSPRLGPDVTPEEVWSSFCEVMGNRVGLPQAVPGSAPAVPEGQTMADVIATRIKEQQAAGGVDLGRFSTDGILRLAQYNLFPNATVLVWGDMMSVLIGRPGSTPSTAEFATFSLTRGSGPRRPPVQVERTPESDFGLVINADVGVLLTMQRGIEQPGFTEVVLSAEECRIINLHQNLEKQLGL